MQFTDGQILTIITLFSAGVHMIPDLRRRGDMSFVYSKKSNPKYNQDAIQLRQRYVNEINAYLDSANFVVRSAHALHATFFQITKPNIKIDLNTPSTAHLE